MDRSSSEYRSMPLVSMRQLPDRTMRPRIRWLLAALLVPCAMAQTPELDRQREYWRQQEEQRQEQQRRAQEEMQRQQKSTEEAKKKQQQEWDDDRRKEADGQWQKDAPKRRAQTEHDARNAAEFKALRAKLLGMPRLPDKRNALLGRWRVESDGKPQRKDELGQLMGMLANPGRAACQFTFGGGIIEFKPKSWASIDGYGDDSLGPIAYRADGKRVFALPAKGVEMMGFELAHPNRVVVVNIEGCALVRVAGTTTTTQSGLANRAPLTSGASVPLPAAGAAPKSSTALQAAGAVVDGAAFRCGDGSLLHVSLCQGNANDATCKLTELHLPGLQMGKPARRAEIAVRVNGCQAGGIAYGADNKPVFVR